MNEEDKIENLKLLKWAAINDLMTVLRCGGTLSFGPYRLEYVHYLTPPDDVRGLVMLKNGEIMNEFKENIEGALSYIVDLLARLDDNYLPF